MEKGDRPVDFHRITVNVCSRSTANPLRAHPLHGGGDSHAGAGTGVGAKGVVKSGIIYIIYISVALLYIFGTTDMLSTSFNNISFNILDYPTFNMPHLPLPLLPSQVQAQKRRNTTKTRRPYGVEKC